MSRVLPALSSATALLLTGCMVGPKYVKPTVPLAPTYKEADTASTQNSGWQKALPADAAQKGEWWVIFNDQELNALEALVAQQNQDLKAAEARFREARTQIPYNRSLLLPTIGATPFAGGLRA